LSRAGFSRGSELTLRWGPHDLAQARCFTGALRKLEPKRLRYRALHVAGRLVRTGHRLTLRLDQDWPWATDLAQAFNRLRAAPWPG